MIETLTVRETLLYAAQLKLPQEISDASKRNRVDEVIGALNLQKCADSRIGGALTRGISGGEAKRVAIGIELLTEPQLLFLDEPTSGLDSSTSYDVVSVLKSIARSGRLVVCTIHQPSADTLMLFDRLMILGAGRTLYLGPTEKASKYFKELGFVPKTKYTNPADFVLAAGGAGGHGAVGTFISKAPELSMSDLWAKFDVSPYGVECHSQVQAVASSGKSKTKTVVLDSDIYATSGPYAFAILFRRAFTKNNRVRHLSLSLSASSKQLTFAVVGASVSRNSTIPIAVNCNSILDDLLAVGDQSSWPLQIFFDSILLLRQCASAHYLLPLVPFLMLTPCS